MIDWVAIRMLCVELERTLPDENAEKMRKKLWGAIRAIASKSPLWPQRRELE